MKNMSNKPLTALAVVLVFLLAPATLGQQITVVLDPKNPPPAADYQGMLNNLLSVWQEFALVPPITTLNIMGLSSSEASSAGYPNNIGIAKGAGPDNPNDYWNAFYFTVAHETVGHLYPPGSGIANHLLAEGIAQSAANTAWWLLHQRIPNFRGRSSVFMADAYRNQDPRAFGGEQRYDLQYHYEAAAGLFELLSGGDYRRMDSLILNSGLLGCPNLLPDQCMAKYLELFDQAFGDFGGRKPSEYFLSSPMFKLNGPDGQFLSVKFGQRLVRDRDGKIILEKSELPVYNQAADGFYDFFVRDRQAGIGKVRKDGKVKWEFFDSQENLVFTAEAPHEPKPPLEYGGYYSQDFPDLSDGTYRLRGTWQDPLDPGKPPISAVFYFTVLRNIPEWWQDGIAIFNNGGRSNGYAFDKFATEKLQLVKQPGDVTEAFELPGMLFVKLHGSKKPIVVSDGTRSNTFLPSYNPLQSASATNFVHWTEYGEKLHAVADGADWTTGHNVPGGIYALFGKDFATKQTWAESIPLPTTLDNIQVLARVNGIDYPCPLYYTSPTQINYQAPVELPIAEAYFRVLTNGAATNPLRVELRRSAPSLFYSDFARKTPAAIFAAGPKTGQAVSQLNPAGPGDHVSLYANALGPVSPPVASGKSSEPRQLSAAIDPVEVRLGDQSVPAAFAGLAPGFVGLYQINFQVPANAPSGLAALTVRTGQAVSTKAELYIQ